MTARAAALYRTARAAMARRDAGAAQQTLGRLLSEFPDYPFGWLAYSILALDLRQPAKALDAARRGLQLAPNEPALLVQLVRALTQAGCIREARAELAAAEPLVSASPDMLHELGNAAAALDLNGDALRILQAARTGLGDVPALCYNMAAVLRFLGRFAESESCLDTLIRQTPRDSAAHLMRAQLRRQTRDRNHVADLVALLNDNGLGWKDRVNLHYALAKECEDLGDYENAFAHVRQGASLRRAHLDYDVTEDLAAMARIAQCFAAAPPCRTQPSAQDPCPIFIFGLPRSGTTLIERILGCHPHVTPLGEINDFPLAVINLASPPGRGLAKLDLIEAAARIPATLFGSAYRARITARAEGAHFVTDKLPMNYLYAGLIAGALPDARLVLVLRDPAANGYGLYKTLFQQGYPFSYDLDEIGRYIAAYHSLVAHWRRCLGENLFVLRYEDLVTDRVQVTRALLAYCGLGWHEACLKPEANTAPATTQSAVQVREEVHARNLDLWRKVEHNLAPLTAHLGN